MSERFAEFGGSLTANVLEFHPDAIQSPNTLFIRMTRGERRIADELRKAFGGFTRVVIDVDGEQHEFSADSLIRLLEGYEGSSSQECHATQPNYEHCKYSTNRGWCDTSRYAALFGTPERAARTLAEFELDHLNWCHGTDGCEKCPYEFDRYGCFLPDGFSLLEWLRGDAE